MSTSEASIAIDDAVEGMVLAHELRDGASGAVLLPAGASLTRASLASLARRGIERLQVVADEPPPDPAAEQAAREQRCVRLAQLFRHSAGSGATDRLIGRLMHYRREG